MTNDGGVRPLSTPFGPVRQVVQNEALPSERRYLVIDPRQALATAGFYHLNV